MITSIEYIILGTILLELAIGTILFIIYGNKFIKALNEWGAKK